MLGWQNVFLFYFADLSLAFLPTQPVSQVVDRNEFAYYPKNRLC